MANSLRKCKHCHEYKPAADGIKTPAGWFCCHSCAIDFAWDKSRKLAARKAAAQHRERKMEVKPLSYWMKRAQAAFNAWVRERDAGQPCISCGRHHQGQYHAGHYRPAGSNPELRFEPDNCHLQCAPCNSHLSGNLTAYRPALIAKIGLERVEWLEGPHEPKRYRREDYQAIEAEYKAKLKKLQGGCGDSHFAVQANRVTH
ncbi:recombination protein NinG [Pseudomonas sp.]|uniref:recombination protein NinG n=1 Tax=Pseudomonas sp. TaxID=306 RepID=UPI002582C951|nr:recombination protein NinG [Pseudomonas sp.]